MKLIFASHNENKIKEFRELFQSRGIEIISLFDLDDHEEIVETGTTFQENAVMKAKTIYAKYKIPTLADDSGLSVMALDGFPGVNSARFMAGSKATDKNLALIEKLKPFSDKRAKFIAAIALVGLDEYPQVFTGETKGLIINEERGKDGFGYDPIFYVPNLMKTFAELPAEEKNAISHRGRATSKLLEYIDNYVN
ncbi:MAG TPA: RdgB/HAM1 family non-canonical purine NTP pyrophosphatase [Bacilli bacterium]|nr:RdgB/HAM1 family non-canonical purine NTP pyrophosphatase [Bacilli bacterium]